jgi:MFS family permease
VTILLVYMAADGTLTPFGFSLLMGTNSLPALFVPFMSGALMYQYGYWYMTFIYLSMTVVGQLIFAAAVHANVFWLMLVGQLIFGAGACCTSVAQRSLISIKCDSSMSFATGAYVAMGCIAKTAGKVGMAPMVVLFDSYFVIPYLSALLCFMSLAMGIGTWFWLDRSQVDGLGSDDEEEQALLSTEVYAYLSDSEVGSEGNRSRVPSQAWSDADHDVGSGSDGVRSRAPSQAFSEVGSASASRSCEQSEVGVGEVGVMLVSQGRSASPSMAHPMPLPHLATQLLPGPLAGPSAPIVKKPLKLAVLKRLQRDITMGRGRQGGTDGSMAVTAELQMLPYEFWIIVTVHGVYILVFHTLANFLPHYIVENFDTTVVGAGLLASLSSVTSIVVAPLIGLIIDIHGRHIPVSLGAAMVSSVAFGMLVFTHVLPVLPICLIAVAQSVIPTILLSVLPLFMPCRLFSLGFGVVEVVDALVMITGNMAFGELYEATGSYWTGLACLFAMTVVGIVLFAVLIILAYRWERVDIFDETIAAYDSPATTNPRYSSSNSPLRGSKELLGLSDLERRKYSAAQRRIDRHHLRSRADEGVAAESDGFFIGEHAVGLPPGSGDVARNQYGSMGSGDTDSQV